MPTRKVLRSLELFAKEVYPAVRELGAQGSGTAESGTSEQSERLRVLA